MIAITLASLTMLLLSAIGFAIIKTMLRALDLESRPQAPLPTRSPTEQRRFLAREAEKLAVLTGDYSYP